MNNNKMNINLKKIMRPWLLKWPISYLQFNYYKITLFSITRTIILTWNKINKFYDDNVECCMEKGSNLTQI